MLMTAVQQEPLTTGVSHLQFISPTTPTATPRTTSRFVSVWTTHTEFVVLENFSWHAFETENNNATQIVQTSGDNKSLALLSSVIRQRASSPQNSTKSIPGEE